MLRAEVLGRERKAAAWVGRSVTEDCSLVAGQQWWGAHLLFAVSELWRDKRCRELRVERLPLLEN